MVVALAQAWVQADHDGGRTLDGSAAIVAFFFWAGIIRGLITREVPAVAVTAPGVFNGSEFYRWEEIGDVRMEDEDLIYLTVNGHRRFLELPETTVKGADIFSLVNYYLVRSGERARIPDALWPPIVSHGPARRP